MRRARPLCALSVLVAIALSLGFASSALAVGTGSITGVVTEFSLPHSVIPGIEVCAYSTNAEGFGCAVTESAGSYVIPGLPSGEYDVEFSPPFESPLNFVSQYYAGAASVAAATPVTVTAGIPRSGVDAELETGGEISGTVTNAAGAKAAIKGIEVCAFSKSVESIRCATTSALGEYTIVGLASDEYDVEFSSPFESGLNFISQYYDGAASLSKAKPVPVIAPGIASGIDAQLEEGGRITGKVTSAATGAAIQNAFVCATPTAVGEGGGCTFTSASGEYAISALAGGSYEVVFDAGKEYVLQYYNNRFSAAEAQPVMVTPPGVTSGINAAMQTVGSPPVNTKAPTVSGSPAVGSALLCVPGLWAGVPTPTLTEQWLRDGVPIAGASGTGYTVQSTDAGHKLSCEVTAKNAKGEKSATSATVAIPASPPPPPAPIPVVTITRSQVVVSGSSAKVSVKCSNASCRGTLELTVQVVVKRRKGKRTVVRRETLVLARGSYSLAAGKSATIVLHLTTTGKRRLAHVKRHPIVAKLKVSVTGAKPTSKSVLVR